MISRRLLITASLVGAFSMASLASCSSSSLSVASVAVSGEARIPTGVTTQLTAAASVARGGIVHDVTASATWTSSAPSIASVSEGLVRGISPGVATISAATSGTSGTFVVTVTDATLTSIDIGPALTLPAGVGKRLSATGTYSDLTTRDITASVTWTTSAPSVATVSNGGDSMALVTSAAAGLTTITATDPATGIAGSAAITVNSAQLVSIAITPNRPSVPLGMTQQFTAVGTYTDATTQDVTASVNWSSSSASVATISTTGAATGLASAMGTGSTTVTASDPVTGVSASTDLTVTAARLTALAITPPAPSIALGAKQQLTATGTYTDATTRDLTASVIWESSAPSTAQVSNTAGSNGLAIAAGVGSATIKATDPSGISATATMTVTPAQLTSIAVTPVAPSLPVGLSRQFTATGTYTDGSTHDLTASVTWASSASTTASVSNAVGSAGVATALAVGSAAIRATDPASGISGAGTLTVTAAQLTSITVTPTAPSTPLGLTTQFTATGKYTNASTQDLTANVTWSSANATVASVSNAAASKGLASTLATGATTITATDPASGISASTLLTVTAARLVSIAVTPAAQSVPSGLTVQFTAMGIYTDASTQNLTVSATWSSSTPAIASISNAAGSQGVATAGVIGTTTITATDPATNIAGSTTLTVTAAQLVSIAITPSSPSVPSGLTKQFTATGRYTNGTTEDLTSAVTWSSSLAGVATISNAASSNGLAATASTGTTTITAVHPTTSISGSTTLTVTAAQLASIAVTPATASVPLGLTQQFRATGTYTDSTTQDLTAVVTWSSSAPTVADVSNASGSQGLATTLATGRTTITAAAPNTGFTASATLEVTAAQLVSIAVTPASASIAAGQMQQFTATATYTDSTTYDITTTATWSSSDTAVATISNASGSNGLATAAATASGTSTMTVTATVPGTNPPVTGTATLTVTP
jgi:uncharacterized protein YjdB